MQQLYRDWRMAPALEVDGFLFLTGFNGAPLEGAPSADPGEQIRTAFNQVEMVLAQAGLTFVNLASVTSYHVGIRDHLALFRQEWNSRMIAPYPAWTAIDVVGFATEGVIVELQAIAKR